jgi:hypothetical protein
VASAALHPPSLWREAAAHNGFGGAVAKWWSMGAAGVHVKGGDGATRGRCLSAWMAEAACGWQP